MHEYDLIPAGYAETMDTLNRHKDWDVPGVIADIAENLRRGNDVPHGQTLAVIDTLTFRMRDITSLNSKIASCLIACDSELSAQAHGRPASSKEELLRLSDLCRRLAESL